jgi:uncharacterized RDD family membrane protein YckC
MTMEPPRPDQPDPMEPETPPEVASEPVPAPGAPPAPTGMTPEPVPAPPTPIAAAPVAAAPPPAPPPAQAWQAPPEPAGPFPGVRFAEHGGRLLSFILDNLIILGISILIAVVFGIMAAVFATAGVDFLSATSALAAVLGFFAVYFVYFPYFWMKDGQTLGMRPFHMRVVMDKDGGPVTLGPAVLRLIGYWIDALVFYLGFIWVLIDSRRRGWHDLIASTVVVQDE